MFDYTVRTVACWGAASASDITGGALGSVVLRRQSLLGDAMSHAAPCNTVIRLYAHAQQVVACAHVGAGIAGISVRSCSSPSRQSRIKEDSQVRRYPVGIFLALAWCSEFLQRDP